MKRAYKSSPGVVQKKLHALYRLKNVLQFPKYEKTDTIPKFCLSFDMEMALGAVHSRHPWRRDLILRGRKILPLLLKTLEKHKIPATWAICGHLFLKGCRGHKDLDYPRGWFQEDPCTNWRVNKYWYAPNIIKKIISSELNNEIACHSFSHISFSHCNKKTASLEIRECIKAVKNYRIKFQSFVFPYNEIGHLKILKKYKFQTFRSRRLWVGEPKLNNGLWEIPSAGNIINIPGMKNHIFKILKSGMENGGIIHFWSHPWDFDKNLISNLLNPLFENIKKEASKGNLEIIRMKDVLALTGVTKNT